MTKWKINCWYCGGSGKDCSGGGCPYCYGLKSIPDTVRIVSAPTKSTNKRGSGECITNEANAHLISAAPEMLCFLEALRDDFNIDECCCEETIESAYACFYHRHELQLLDLIKKARKAFKTKE